MKKILFSILCVLSFASLKAQDSFNEQKKHISLIQEQPECLGFPYVFIALPASNQVYNPGTSVTFSWSNCSQSGQQPTNVDIMMANSVTTTILTQNYAYDGDNDPSNGRANTYTVNIPTNQKHGSYRIWLRDVATGATAVSGNVLKVINLSDIPQIITSQNSSLAYDLCSNITVTWNSDVVFSNVKVEYIASTNSTQTIIASTNNTGSYTFNSSILYNTSTGGYFKVSDVNYPSINDINDAPFTVGTCKIFTYPNNGEQFSIGDQLTVRWDQTRLTGANVKIYHTTPYGGTIVASTPNDGEYSFTITENYPINGSVYSGYIFGVEDNTGKKDVCDVPFGINNNKWLASPNSGNYFRGNSLSVIWNSSFVTTSQVKIELIKNGSVVHDFGSSANISFRSVTIPAWIGTGTDYKIRISSPSGFSDTSDGFINIQ